MFSRNRSGPSVPVAPHKLHLLAFALATAANTVAGSREPSHKPPILSRCGKAAAPHRRSEAGVQKTGGPGTPATDTWSSEVLG